MQNRHGHSMSLAQPPTHQSPFYTPSPTFNPFGPHATLGDSPGPLSAPLENIHAPQGRIPVTAASLALPPSLSRPESRPDFARGFGLEVPEEEEEEVEEFVGAPVDTSEDMDEAFTEELQDSDRQEEEAQYDEQDGMTTAAQSRLHSRHVSNALSLGSVGGGNELTPSIPVRNTEFEEDVMDEWTGSEDLQLSDGDEVNQFHYH